jgi:hypothetical protein
MLPTEGGLSRASASYRMQQREHVCRLRAADRDAGRVVAIGS